MATSNQGTTCLSAPHRPCLQGGSQRPPGTTLHALGARTGHFSSLPACLSTWKGTGLVVPCIAGREMQAHWGPVQLSMGGQMTRFWLQRTWVLVSGSGEFTAQLPLMVPAWGPGLTALHSANRASRQLSSLGRSNPLPGHSPTQFFPSGVRSYPSWHRHWKEPMLLMHWPFRHTCPTRDEHSSMSVGGKR